jgi:capsular polysaccharide transport system permease protein
MRVIGALFMREIQLRWGRRNLGFAWLLAEPLIFAFPVLIMWRTMRGSAEHGMPLMPFLWSGYLPLLLFRHVTGHALLTIRNNGALLYHRDVTPLDILLGRCGLEAIGNLAASALSFLVFYMLDEIEWPSDPALFLLGFFYMTWWAIAVALIVGAWSERSEMVQHIWQPISYMYLPISGFFYMAEWLPTTLRSVALSVMPSLHAYEMIRGGLFGGRMQVFYDVGYVSFYLAILTLFGLWLVRDVRRHVEFD